ncbi:MAG: glyoxylate/hydroxypyruvate reductase A, partial [Wenzhouxiangellaceae bacterium]|nr:glyoxylate/hydroxypyruvate reductase A [Wenzhouxiangellaceae bacterium]
MALLIATPDREDQRLAELVSRALPGADVRRWPDLGHAEDIEFALVWRAPRGLYAKLPNLKAVSSLGAGVDAILADPDLPPDLAVGRLAGPRLAANMAAYL